MWPQRITLLLWFATLLCLGVLSPPAAQELIWTPPSITTMMAPGDSHPFTLSFLVSRDLGYGSVRAEARLQPFVQIAPHELRGLVKGQRVRLVVTVSVPANAPHGTVVGAVRLFEDLHLGVKGGGVKILSRPLPFANPLLITLQVVPRSASHREERNDDPGATDANRGRARARLLLDVCGGRSAGAFQRASGASCRRPGS